MSVKRGLAQTLLIFLILLILTVSCSSQRYDPNYWHQGFLVALQESIGQRFAIVRRDTKGNWGQDKDLVGQAEQSNGNIAYKYRYIRTCRYILEVDPKTDIVVNANWEGDKGDCIIVP